MRPRHLLLPLLLLAMAAVAGAAETTPARELFLAGGALAVCSDLAPRACATPPDGARGAPRYRLDDAGIAAASDPALWRAPGAPRPAEIARLLETARAGLADGAAQELSAAALEAALDAACAGDACADGAARDPWPRLLDVERAALQSALEQPAPPVDGQRPRERADPGRSTVRGGVRVLEAFVAAARGRAGGRPRIAVVTASAFDPMEPVDFYRSLFEALGADASWWPVDAALAAARFEARDCAALPRLRAERLRLARRAAVYPDLAAQQQAYCAAGEDALPDAHGVFFAGGDQWRLRQAFVDGAGRANPWLLALREAHAAGRVVVGGTSAGAAVQSGAWMLGNGSVEQALARAPSTAPPPEPGCGRGARCGGVPEDVLALWPDGGLGLATDAIVDTHFSERARELRLLRAMQAAGARWGYGADETSALHVRERGGQREISALGERGGWVLHRPPGTPEDHALAWYLVPGAVLQVDAEGVRLRPEAGARRARRTTDAPPTSAFEAGALRALAQRLAAACDSQATLRAGALQASLRCAPGARGWRGPGALDGVGPLHLRLAQADAR
jgi:cyanophycinase